MGWWKRRYWSACEIFSESPESKRQKIYSNSKENLLKEFTLIDLQDLEEKYGIGQPVVYSTSYDKNGNLIQVQKEPTREDHIRHIKNKLTLSNLENYLVYNKGYSMKAISRTSIATYNGYIKALEVSISKILKNIDRINNTKNDKDFKHLVGFVESEIADIKNNENYIADLDSIKDFDAVLNFGLTDLFEKLSDLIGYEQITRENLDHVAALAKAANTDFYFIIKSIERINSASAINNLFVPDNKSLEYIASKRAENNIYEFKGSLTNMENICREISAFSHCKFGGIIFYGIEDTGTISNGINGDKNDFDNRLRNAIKGLIAPAPNIQIIERNPKNKRIFAIVVAPWDKKSVYKFRGNSILIRRGGNVFAANNEEIKSLESGEFIC